MQQMRHLGRHPDEAASGHRWLLLLAVILLALCLALVTSRSAAAADLKLDSFKIVIGDTGDHYSRWDADPNRVYVTVTGGDRRPRHHYFSDMASAFYVLDRRYGSPDYVDFRVHAVDSPASLLDARHAYYFWDTERVDRGGTPLILAFAYRDNARDMARQHRGEVLDYDGLRSRLRSWLDDNRSAIYWRGQDSWDEARWSRAWNDRWPGWAYDTSRGWSISLSLGSRNGRDHERNWRNHEQDWRGPRQDDALARQQAHERNVVAQRQAHLRSLRVHQNAVQAHQNSVRLHQRLLNEQRQRELARRRAAEGRVKASHRHNVPRTSHQRPPRTSNHGHGTHPGHSGGHGHGQGKGHGHH